MSSEPLEEQTPTDPEAVSPVQPADWIKPVELIELLQRRKAKRRTVEAPTSSPFYDAEFVATHKNRKPGCRRRHGPGSSSSSSNSSLS